MSEERLREYIESDKAYQEYKTKKPSSDYKRLHFSLCEDIENVLEKLNIFKEEYYKTVQERDYWLNKCAESEYLLYEREQILDEIREYCMKGYPYVENASHDILQILDKVK